MRSCTGVWGGAVQRCSAGHVVYGHGKGAFTQASSGVGGGGDDGGGLADEGIGPGRDRGIGACAGSEGVTREGEGEVGGRMEEWEQWVGEAAVAEEGVVHCDVTFGHPGPRLGGDPAGLLFARREDGREVGQDAMERLQGRGAQLEDGPSGGGDGAGGEDCRPGDVTASGGRLVEGGRLRSQVLGDDGEGELQEAAEQGGGLGAREAKGVPGAPVLLMSPRSKHTSGRRQEPSMSLASDSHSE